ncbi:MAG TPA: endonuclease [Luteimonas sp.]
MRPERSTLFCAITLAVAATFPAQAEVFINEIHYDNAGADVGEAIEVVGSAGEDLTGYQLVLYNGSNNQTYSTTALPAGNPVTCGGNVRIATVNYPVDGLQNGSPDGVALVDPQGNVVEFLSYEGTMTAANGPAAGMTSVDIGVSEPNNTPVGTSLQLRGDGNVAADFTWAGSATATFGTCNNEQTFGEPGNAAPRVVSTFPVDGANDFPYAADLSVTFSEPVVASPGAFTLSCNGMARRRAPALDHVREATTFSLTPAAPLLPGQACTLHIDADRIADLDDSAPEADTSIAFQVKPADGGGSQPGEYYGRVNDSSPGQLRCSLHETIRGHVAYPYSGSGTNTWTILEIADEDPNDPGKILDVYRNRSYTKGSDRAGSGGSNKYNREHTWPNSLGFPSNSRDGLPNAPYTDTHMLYLSDEGYNSNRGNMPFANCEGGCTERPTEANNGRGGGSGTYPGNSNWYRGPNGNTGSFEVWGDRKGDMARAVMYMAIRYEGGQHPTTGQQEPDLELTDNRNLIVGTSSLDGPAYMGLLSTLIEWHLADPPDDAERARNEVIFGFQGNRNPFIDHPEWATQALFTSTSPATCELATPKPAPPRNRLKLR